MIQSDQRIYEIVFNIDGKFVEMDEVKSIRDMKFENDFRITFSVGNNGQCTQPSHTYFN